MTDKIEHPQRHRLQGIVAGIEGLKAELAVEQSKFAEVRTGINTKIKALYKDAKSLDLDTKALKEFIRRRAAGEPDLELEAQLQQFELWMNDPEPVLVKDSQEGGGKGADAPAADEEPAGASAKASSTGSQGRKASQKRPPKMVAVGGKKFAGRGKASDYKLVHGGAEPGANALAGQ